MHQLGSIGFNELMMPHAPYNTAVAASPAVTARARGAKALHMIHLSELLRIGGCDAVSSWRVPAARAGAHEFSMFIGVLILFLGSKKIITILLIILNGTSK
jgi:hypothetical protein